MDRLVFSRHWIDFPCLVEHCPALMFRLYDGKHFSAPFNEAEKLVVSGNTNYNSKRNNSLHGGWGKMKRSRVD